MRNKNLKYKKITDFDLVIKYLHCNFSSPTHWPEWNILVSKYFKTIFYYFGLFENNELIGICPVHETKSGLTKKLHSGQFHFIPNGGWLLNKKHTIDISRIPIKKNALFECFALPTLNEFCVSYTNIKKVFYTLIIDLTQNEEQIWMESLNYRRRRMIKKAKKNGIIVKNVNSNLTVFYSLYLMANINYGLKSLAYSFFDEMSNNKVVKFIPLVAFNNGAPCGALGLIHDSNYAIYWLGAADHRLENLGQGELLQWEAIKHSKSAGCKYYDLCYIEKERLPNIYEFKRGFSDRELGIPYFVKKPMLFRIINQIRKK